MPNPSPPPINNIIFLEFQLCIGWWEGRTGIIGTFYVPMIPSLELLRSNDTMSLNILAAIASRTSLLASSTSMPGFYLDSCQTLIIGEEGELQVIFKSLHCFIRISRNERKLRILLHCPKNFCPGL